MDVRPVMPDDSFQDTHSRRASLARTNTARALNSFQHDLAAEQQHDRDV